MPLNIWMIKLSEPSWNWPFSNLSRMTPYCCKQSSYWLKQCFLKWICKLTFIGSKFLTHAHTQACTHIHITSFIHRYTRSLLPREMHHRISVKYTAHLCSSLTLVNSENCGYVYSEWVIILHYCNEYRILEMKQN